MKKNIIQFFAITSPPVGLFVLVLVVWQALTHFFSLPPYLVPAPTKIVAAAVENFPTLSQATALTGFAALCGFILSLAMGTLTAFAFSQSPLIRKSFYPYAIFLQTVPIVAVAPLIIIWFGTGFKSVVLVSFIISLFPVVTNATSGLTRIDTALSDLFKLHGATRVQTLLKLSLPHAVPYIVTGAKISCGLSVIGAIVGEFFAGYGSNVYGLGYLIIQTSGQLNTALLFAAIFASTLLGIVFFGIATFFGDVVLQRWQALE